MAGWPVLSSHGYKRPVPAVSSHPLSNQSFAPSTPKQEKALGEGGRRGHFLQDGSETPGKNECRRCVFARLREELLIEGCVHKAVRPQGWKRLKTGPGLMRVDDFPAGTHAWGGALRATTGQGSPSEAGAASRPPGTEPGSSSFP